MYKETNLKTKDRFNPKELLGELTVFQLSIRIDILLYPEFLRTKVTTYSTFEELDRLVPKLKSLGINPNFKKFDKPNQALQKILIELYDII